MRDYSYEELRAERDALKERLSEYDGLWHCTMKDKAAADAHFFAWEKRALTAEDRLAEATRLLRVVDEPNIVGLNYEVIRAFLAHLDRENS